MKILKIFGIVVGIHVFALILIFANPGCSSTSKPPPQPADTVAKADAGPAITVPAASMVTPTNVDTGAPVSPAPITFNPDAPATSGGSGPGIRFTPTRPNTPEASVVLAQPVDNVTPVTTYVVKSGDNLWTIQKKFHVSVKEIAAANNIKTSSPLHDGQKLIIPSKSSVSTTKAGAAAPAPMLPASAPKSETAATGRSANGEVTYTVRPGDTIEAIAKKYEVKWKDLAVHNNIDNPQRLRAGTVLNIPGWKSTSKGGDTAAKSSSRPSSKSSVPSEPAPTPTPTIMPEQPPIQPNSDSSVPVIRIDEPPATSTPTPKS